MSLFDAREFVDEQNDILNELSDELVAKFDPYKNMNNRYIDNLFPNYYGKIIDRRMKRYMELEEKQKKGSLTDKEKQEMKRLRHKGEIIHQDRSYDLFDRRISSMDKARRSKYDKIKFESRPPRETLPSKPEEEVKQEPKKETNIPKQDEQKSQSTPKNPTPKGNSGGGGTSKKKSSPSTSSTPDSQPSWLSRNKYKAGAGALVGAAAGYGIYKKRHAIKNKLSNLWNRIRGRKQY